MAALTDTTNFKKKITIFLCPFMLGNFYQTSRDHKQHVNKKHKLPSTDKQETVPASSGGQVTEMKYVSSARLPVETAISILTLVFFFLDANIF